MRSCAMCPRMCDVTVECSPLFLNSPRVCRLKKKRVLNIKLCRHYLSLLCFNPPPKKSTELTLHFVVVSNATQG